MGESQGPTPREHYRQRKAALQEAVGRLEETVRGLTRLRGAVFIGAVVGWIVADLAGVPWAGAGLVILGAVAFFVLVRRHRAARTALERARAGRAWAEQGLARLDRRWDLLPDPVPGGRKLDEHAFATDLDLFGRASLASLLGPVHTPAGKALLASWLLDPADLGSVSARQAAIQELAGDRDQLERVSVEGALYGDQGKSETGEAQGLADFLEWCGEDGVLPSALGLAAWILPVLSAGLFAVDLAAGLPAWPWVVLLGVQAALAHRWGSRLHREFALAASGLPGLRRIQGILEAWEGYPAQSPEVDAAVDSLGSGPAAASRALARLERLRHLADLRLSSLYPVFAVLLLWDVHVARGMLAWRRAHGGRVAAWLDALGELEALSALATVAADNPDWAYPRWGAEGYSATGLGHPLLPPDACVRNDVELGGPGALLLVTGSNMSGKSTLLRAVGLSVAMAGAGLPVCARALDLPRVRLFTSMRVQDSLQAGVSFFMAELLRLKALLDAAPEWGNRDAPPLLYLVDEILQGTNSQERRAAGRHLVRSLLRRRAMGAVTTHDLDFHRHPELEARARLVHFRESLSQEGAGLSFDYRLRPGLATTRNALRLAERVGLTEPTGELPPADV